MAYSEINSLFGIFFFFNMGQIDHDETLHENSNN